LDVDGGTRKDEEPSTLNTTKERQNQTVKYALLFLKCNTLGKGAAHLLAVSSSLIKFIKLVLDLSQLHQLILDVLQCFHFIPNEIAIAVRKHPEENALEAEALCPLLADRRRQLCLKALQLIQQVIDLLL
jgi:hypothetical protein